MLSSPPLRLTRSPGGISHSPWEADARTMPAIPRRYNSPRRYSTQPLPPLPSSPMFSPAPALPSYATPPPSSSRRSPAPSPGSGTPKRSCTPPPRNRTKTNSKLLPALPLSINTQLTSPVSKSHCIEVEDSPYDGIQITVSQDTNGASYAPNYSVRRDSCVSPKSTTPAVLSPRPIPPPRPARRMVTDPTDLQPPQPGFRASSPSGSSVSTITGDITPKMAFPPERADSAPPVSDVSFVTATATSTPMVNKRDSAQRRLSALRGLVANLDFNQHWSISEKAEQEEGEMFWACGEPDPEPELEPEIENVRIPPVVIIEKETSPPIVPTPVRKVSQDHGWPSPPKGTPDFGVQVLEKTPLRQASLPRRPVSTPPRRPRLLAKSSSELLSRTPDPPRPSKQRMENYGVASSGYNKSLEQPNSPSVTDGTSTTWRSSLSTDLTFQELLQAQGKLEVKRQEIMWEMCETEQSFVKSMRTVLRLFAIPLKTPQGKWIDGIPPNITVLFDSLECVAHAHGIIAAAQRDMRRKSETLDTLAFTTMFRSWVSRLEVHEWYLLRFESVVQQVEDNVRDPASVFGEFVRMQMKDEVLGSMSLGSMLLKPVQRLTKYPLFLKRLLDVTPHPHPAQPELLSLLSTTESIILRLQATKAREEDFERLQALESRLHGLPEDFTLAVRGRKLIGSGQVCRVLPGKEIAASLVPRNRADSLHSSRGSISSASVSSSSASSSPWEFSAFSPISGRTSAFSVSSASSGYPPSRSNSISQCGSSPRPGVSRSPSSASSVTSDHRSPSSASSRTRRKDESLTMFIFDDLVIVAASLSEKSGLFASKRKGPKSALRVLSENEGGIGKVLEVKDWSGWQGHASLFALTTVPLTYTARSPLVSPVTTAYTIPGPASPRRGSVSTPANCPTLTAVPHFLSILAQATTATSGNILSEYIVDDSSNLESIGEGHEWSDSSMGYAQ